MEYNSLRNGESYNWNSIKHLRKSGFFIDVAETLATRILTLIASFILSVVIARLLQPQGQGLYAVVVTLVTLAIQIGNMGLYASNIYFISKDQEPLPAAVGNSLLVGFFMGVLIMGITYPLLTFWPNLRPLQGMMLLIVFLWIPFSLSYMLLQHLLLGIQKIRLYNIVEVFTKLFVVAVILCTAALSKISVSGVLIVNVLGSVIGFLWILLYLQGKCKTPIKTSLPLLKKHFFYSFKVYLAALFSFLLLKIDILMLKYLTDTVQTGYYSIAVMFGEAISMAPVVVGTILFPKLSAMSEAHEKWIFTRKIAGIIGVVMIVLAGGIAVFLEPILQLSFGAKYLPSISAIKLLLPGIVMLSVSSIYMNYIASIGMPLAAVFIPAIASFSNVVLNLRLIPLLGINGAAIASTFCYGLMFCMTFLYFICKKYDDKSIKFKQFGKT